MVMRQLRSETRGGLHKQNPRNVVEAHVLGLYVVDGLTGTSLLDLNICTVSKSEDEAHG